MLLGWERNRVRWPNTLALPLHLGMTRGGALGFCNMHLVHLEGLRCRTKGPVGVMGAATTPQGRASAMSTPTPIPKMLAQCPLSQRCLVNVYTDASKREVCSELPTGRGTCNPGVLLCPSSSRPRSFLILPLGSPSGGMGLGLILPLFLPQSPGGSCACGVDIPATALGALPRPRYHRTGHKGRH